MPDPGWLLSLQTNKHVTTNTSVDQTSDELEMVSVYAVRERNDALRLFTVDVEKHVINQCLLLFVETCPLQRTVNQGPRRSQRDGRKLLWIYLETVRSQLFQGISLYWKVFLRLSLILLWKHCTVSSSCLSGISDHLDGCRNYRQLVVFVKVNIPITIAHGVGYFESNALCDESA